MSLKIKVYNQSAEAVKDIELAAKVFGVEANSDLLHQAVITQMNNARQVLAHTKDRSEVSGGGKKPWKQKGTGRARWFQPFSDLDWRRRHFGPTKDRNFSQKINQKMKQKALFMAFSDKLATGTLLVVDSLDFSEYKTKKFAAMLDSFEKKVLKNDRRDILVLNESQDEKVRYSGRNLKGVKIINLENVNLVDLLNYKSLLLSEKAIKAISDRYNK